MWVQKEVTDEDRQRLQQMEVRALQTLRQGRMGAVRRRAVMSWLAQARRGIQTSGPAWRLVPITPPAPTTPLSILTEGK